MKNNAQIIAALKGGSTQAFEEVYELFYKGLCAYAAQFVGLEEAEEIVQDTMLGLWENRANLNETLPLKSYLFTIVKNKAINQCNQTYTHRKILQQLNEDYSEAFDSPDLYLRHELARQYKETMQKMSPAIRATFEMHRREQLSYKEIAEKLHVSVQTVNYRICQALKLLRQELKDFQDEVTPSPPSFGRK